VTGSRAAEPGHAGPAPVDDGPPNAINNFVATVGARPDGK